MGAIGVVVPLVRSVDEACAIVSATRYPPEGKRSWGPLRGYRYSFDTDDYFDRANDNIIVALIIETKEALDDLEAIASVPGIDAIHIGPWDMSLSLGLDPRNLPLPEIDAVLDRILEVGRKTGTAVGSSAGTPEALAEARSKGLTFINYGSDYSSLAEFARKGVAAFQQATRE